MEGKLKYVRAGVPGYSRQRGKNGFTYYDQNGKVIDDLEVLDRILKLVLPPAWEDVWICPWPNGHLQATGIDSKGRKQYRYHAAWSKSRNEDKFHKLYAFGTHLPRIRKRIQTDLKHKDLDKPKVIAIALRTMEKTLIRVGNAAYEKLYGSYGLTTLRNKHVRINGGSALFHFKGKKGVMHQVELKETSLVKMLQKVMHIPGQELFQYQDKEGNHFPLDSGEVNEYLREAAGDEFTCKDFRTWAGSVHALHLLSQLEPFQSKTECKRHIADMSAGVASRLGNTATVCRKYYIDPRILTAYESGALEPYLQRLRGMNGNMSFNKGMHQDEVIFLSFLKMNKG
jgi:DNA topoisomerase-1